MFNILLKHIVYEVCIDQFIRRIGLNLLNRVPIPDKHIDYKKCREKWQPVTDSRIAGPVPEHAMRMYIESMEKQANFNKENKDICYEPYQQYALPFIRYMFGNENIGDFKLGKRYQPVFKGAVTIDKYFISSVMNTPDSNITIETLVNQMSALIINEEINGILIRFTEDSLTVYC